MAINFYQFMIRAIFLMVIGLLVVSCSNEVSECPITVDSVRTLEEKEYNGKIYYLVERVTGWHEKTVVIQLFENEPKFGACNEDLVSPLFEDSIESRPLSKLIIDLKNQDFEVVYGETDTSRDVSKIEFIGR